LAIGGRLIWEEPPGELFPLEELRRELSGLSFLHVNKNNDKPIPKRCADNFTNDFMLQGFG